MPTAQRTRFHPPLALLLVLTAVPAHGDPPPPAGMKPYTETIPGTGVTFDMVPIPGGRFMLGSPPTEKGRKEDEGPQVEVEVEPFFMGKHEVTWPEYQAFLDNFRRLAARPPQPIPADKAADAVTYPTPEYALETGPIFDRMGRGPGYPAVTMSHFAARQYCKWISKKTGRFYRLPTEAEWEYACRAGTKTAFSFGNDAKQLDAFAWHFDNSPLRDGDGAYRKVGQKQPNPWGLYDMHGNVAEWCIDEYRADWYASLARRGGVVHWSDAVRWPGGDSPYPRVVRGGSWESDAEDCRSAARLGSDRGLNRHDPTIPQSPFWLVNSFWIGFRVVAPVKEPGVEEKRRFWDVDDKVTRRTLEEPEPARQGRYMREWIPPPAMKEPVRE